MSIRVFIVGHEMKCEKLVFSKRGCIGKSLATGMSREFQSSNNKKARLYFLSCSDPAVLTLQLPACSTRVTFWQVITRESVVRSSHELPLDVHT